MAEPVITMETLSVIGTTISVTFAATVWITNKFGKHELKDELRHRQNLVRFTRLFERLGIPSQFEDDENGHGH